jgi:hypothetical protein
VTTMRSRVRKSAHVLERIGLAMAGAASGLFVAAHVGSSIAVFASQGFIIMMMIGGAVGFYLGIDTPALAFHPPYGRPSKDGSSGKIDSAEFLSAVGTFLATLTAFVSVIVIVFAHLLDNDDHAGMGGWRVDANHCRGDCTRARLILVAFASRPLCLCARTRAN